MSLEHSPNRQRRNTTPRLAFSINEFCAAHGISRTHLYDLWREGTGPRYMLTGTKRLISTEAAAEWRAQGEQAAAAERDRTQNVETA